MTGSHHPHVERQYQREITAHFNNFFPSGKGGGRKIRVEGRRGILRGFFSLSLGGKNAIPSLHGRDLLAGLPMTYLFPISICVMRHIRINRWVTGHKSIPTHYPSIHTLSLFINCLLSSIFPPLLPLQPPFTRTHWAIVYMGSRSAMLFVMRFLECSVGLIICCRGVGFWSQQDPRGRCLKIPAEDLLVLACDRTPRIHLRMLKSRKPHLPPLLLQLCPLSWPFLRSATSTLSSSALVDMERWGAVTLTDPPFSFTCLCIDWGSWSVFSLTSPLLCFKAWDVQQHQAYTWGPSYFQDYPFSHFHKVTLAPDSWNFDSFASDGSLCCSSWLAPDEIRTVWRLSW